MMIRDFSAGVFVPYLTSLDHILAQAEAHPKAATFPDAQLAPDMYPLRKQVQIACQHARNGMLAITTGETPPTLDGPADANLAQLRALVAETLAFVSRVEGPFDLDRVVTQQLRETRVLETTAGRFLREWSYAHFFFHIVTAYDILRVAGLDLGKRNFVFHAGDAISTR